MDHDTSVVTLALLGVPIVGTVVDLDVPGSRLTVTTERGVLEVNVDGDESLDDISLGDVISVTFPIGISDS